MENSASGGSAFVHYAEEPIKNISTHRFPRKKYNSSSWAAILIGTICLIFIVELLTFPLTVVIPHINLWDFNTENNSLEGGFIFPYGSLGNAALWSLLPATLCGIFISACFAFKLVAIPNMLTMVSLTVLVAVSVVLLVMVNPFYSDTDKSISFDEWAESRYGVILTDERTVSKSEGDGITYYAMYHDEKGNIVFSLKDPNRNNEIFLYDSNAKTELKVKSATSNTAS